MGQTPVVKGKRGQSPRYTVIGAVSPEGRSYFQWVTETVTGETVVAFLKTLLRYWAGKLRVIWDNAPVHRCQEVKDLLADPDVQERLRLEALPPYAPELNPAEALWSWLKDKRANLAFKDGVALRAWLQEKTQWLKGKRDFVKQLIKASPIY